MTHTTIPILPAATREAVDKKRQPSKGQLTEQQERKQLLDIGELTHPDALRILKVRDERAAAKAAEKESKSRRSRAKQKSKPTARRHTRPPAHHHYDADDADHDDTDDAKETHEHENEDEDGDVTRKRRRRSRRIRDSDDDDSKEGKRHALAGLDDSDEAVVESFVDWEDDRVHPKPYRLRDESEESFAARVKQHKQDIDKMKNDHGEAARERDYTKRRYSRPTADDAL